jgi:hypothetical protein
MTELCREFVKMSHDNVTMLVYRKREPGSAEIIVILLRSIFSSKSLEIPGNEFF